MKYRVSIQVQHVLDFVENFLLYDITVEKSVKDNLIDIVKSIVLTCPEVFMQLTDIELSEEDITVCRIKYPGIVIN